MTNPLHERLIAIIGDPRQAGEIIALATLAGIPLDILFNQVLNIYSHTP